MSITKTTKSGTLTFEQIINDRDLLDAPVFHFQFESSIIKKTLGGNVQYSHVTVEQLLSVGGLAKTKWTYRRTTEEGIPVFDALAPISVMRCLDLEVIGEGDQDDPYRYWATPKGFPKEYQV